MGGTRESDESRFARLRAEALKRVSAGRGPAGEMSDQDLRTLVHELEVHQVELEVQNEELRRARDELEGLRDRYFDLYEYAPVGYLRLNGHGEIREANLECARLCGTERDKLVGRRFERIAVEADRDICYLLLRKATASEAATATETEPNPDRNEFRVDRPDDRLTWVRAEGKAWDDVADPPAGFRITLTDITARKISEHALRETRDALQRGNEQLEERVAERTAELEEQSRLLRLLMVQLTETEERERRRLADLLHDNLQQVLVATRFRLKEIAGQRGAADAFAPVADLVDESLAIARSLAHELWPPLPHEQGLVENLDWLVVEVKANLGLDVDFSVREVVDGLSATTVSLIFRSVR